MLKKLNEFKESLNSEQIETLRSALSEDIVQRFFSANDEDTATKLVEDLNKHLASRPVVAFGLYQKLSSEQRAMITDLVFDEEED